LSLCGFLNVCQKISINLNKKLTIAPSKYIEKSLRKSQNDSNKKMLPFEKLNKFFNVIYTYLLTLFNLNFFLEFKNMYLKQKLNYYGDIG